MSSRTNESLDSSQADIHDLEKEEISPSDSIQGDAHESGRMQTAPVQPPADPEKAISAVPKTATELGWTGPDDRENPLNWGKLVRHYHIIPPALISFAA
jgi:hypothetical protein